MAPRVPWAALKTSTGKAYMAALTNEFRGFITKAAARAHAGAMYANALPSHNDSNGKCLGLLIEESRTNLWTNSDDPTFTAVNGTVTPSAALAPDGTNTASVFVPNAASDSTDRFLVIPRLNTLSTLQVVTFHVKTTYSYLVFFANGQDSQSNVAVNVGINLSTNSVYQTTEANGTYSSTFITDMANGYKRISIAYQTDGGSGGKQPGIIVSDTQFVIDDNPGRAIDQTANYTTDGTKSLTIWGVQLETGSFPTSYIPTAGATVTRAADLATMPTAGIYGDEFTTINKDFGTASTGTTLSIIGPNTERTVTYPGYLTQTEINEVAGREEDDNFWRWRVLGSSFALANFTTDGQVTVDWGDGTVEVLTQAEHTFTDGAGYHDIGFRLDSGTRFEPRMFGDATHKDKLIAVGPAPASMVVDNDYGFYLCSNLKVIDPTAAFSGANAWTNAFRNCTSLTSFPRVDTTNVIFMNSTWRGCTAMTSFPLLDTSSVQNITSAWYDCTSLVSFPAIDTSSATSFSSTWTNCSGLTSFPFVDSSAVVNFTSAWLGCSSLTAFPAIDTSNSTLFGNTWYNCTGLVSFPLIDTSAATSFSQTWRNCSSLQSFPAIDCSNVENVASTWKGCSGLSSFPSVSFVNATTFVRAWEACGVVDFPAGVFDSWTGTPADNCFAYSWYNCNAMSATSVENILNSIDTSGRSAPATGVDITIDYNAASGTPNITTAVTNLKSRSWTITLNGVAQ